MRFGTFLIAVLSALVLGLSVLLAMGCGSSGDSGTSGGTTSGQQADASQKSETTEESQSGESKAGESSAKPKVKAVRKGPPLTKAVFIKKGDKICAVVPNEYRSLAISLSKEREAAKKPKPSVAEVAEKAAVPPLYKAATKLASLNPPPADVQKADAIVAALESAARGFEENPNSEFGGPKSPFAEFQKLTAAYGLKGCAKL